jgi:hypothetical protein
VGWINLRIQFNCWDGSPDLAGSICSRGMGHQSLCHSNTGHYQVILRTWINNNCLNHLYFISYITLTFVVETMAAANAIMRSKEETRHKRVRTTSERRRDHDNITISDSSSDSDCSSVASPTRNLVNSKLLRNHSHVIHSFPS